MKPLEQCILVAVGLLIGGAVCRSVMAESPTVPTDVAAFDGGVGVAIAEKFNGTAKQWRQIAPSVFYLARDHAPSLEAWSHEDRLQALVDLAEFIEGKRKAVRAEPVLAPDRSVIGLLDPDRGLEPKEITAIADAYRCNSTIFKKDDEGTSLETVAASFLAGVTAVVKSDKPTTIIVLGHGLPTEIQSYHIRFELLAKAMLDGLPPAEDIDLSKIVLICDDCFSADFSINLLGEIMRAAERRGRAVKALPVCIAGTNRNRVGFVSVNEKFVPHFWRDVIELYFIRQPRPRQVTLGNVFENVDNMMYGYGRAPVLEGGHVTGYRLIDADLIQDPVVFVPLDEGDRAKLRAILRLPADAPAPHWLDIG